MMQLTNLFTIARFETKTLLRSWFFRIFAGFVVIVLFIFNLVSFVNPSSVRWHMTGVSAMLPLMNVIMLNYVQSIIAVFLASDFLRRDKKLDTSEVLLVRPVSNGEYVLGKTLGILYVFFLLNALVLLITLLFNYISTLHSIAWEVYLWYPLLITLPGVLFILGFSYLVMMLSKNQAVSYVLVLGFVGLSIFYLNDSLYGLFDFMNTNLPLLYSDMVGFGDFQLLLYQKLMFALIGVGFILITIRIFNRLPHSVKHLNLILSIGLVFVAGGCFSGYSYVTKKVDLKESRESALQTNNLYANYLTPSVDKHKISLVFEQGKLAVIDSLTLRNETEESIDTLLFTLNSGLDVNSVRVNGEQQAVIRKEAILLVPLKNKLQAKEKLNVIIDYAGLVSEDLAYLDVNWEKYTSRKSVAMAAMYRQHAVQTNNYILATPENAWYPTPGVFYNQVNHKSRPHDFADFTLRVKCDTRLMAISQGSCDTIEGGYYFTSDVPMKAISLTIGDYEKKSIRVSDIDYTLFTYKNHDFYSNFFPLIKDTLPAVVDDLHQEFEREIDLFYQYNRLNLVEVPAHFDVFKRKLSQVNEMVQAEIVFLPERGFGLNGVEFHKAERRFSRNNRNNKTKTPLEEEVDKFKIFAYSSVVSGGSRNSRRMTGGSSGYRVNGAYYGTNPFSIFPMYYNHVIAFDDREVPYLNSIFESFYKDGFNVSMYDQFTGGMGDKEKANYLLMNNSIKELLANEEHEENIPAVIRQKGSYLFTLLKGEIGVEEVEDFFYYFYDDHLFEVTSLKQLVQTINDSLDYNLAPHVDQWVNSKDVPAYLVDEPVLVEIQDEYGAAYLLKVKITNEADVPGIVQITLRIMGQRGQGSEEEERIYTFAANETKDIQIMTYDQPRLLTLNTVISKNIPSTTTAFFRQTEKKNYAAEEFAHTVDVPVSIQGVNEIIVDNEDEGFTLTDHRAQSALKIYLDSLKAEPVDDAYAQIPSRRNPNNWLAVAHTGLYGKHIRSGYVTRKGEGDMLATWETELEETGMYDVYMYLPMMAMRTRRGGGNRGRGSGFSDTKTIYNYGVKTESDSLSIEFPLKEAEDGWNRIGSFHFEKGHASISLSNKTNGSRIFADAIKWVKVR